MKHALPYPHLPRANRAWLGAVVLCGLLVGGVAPAASTEHEGVLRIDLPNGIHANVYTPEYLLERLTINGTRGTITLDDGTRLDVVTDVSDPLIENQGDGAFHPYRTDMVISLLTEINYPGLRLEFDILLLPFPRQDALTSSVSGRWLFLSPQVREISREDAAYVVAHEVGHVFQNAYLPLSADAEWRRYRDIRGIDATAYSDGARHADRPVEIFAEDFRVLFGGASAFHGGAVENASVVPPLEVPGLRTFFVDLADGLTEARTLLGVSSYPNPFNPQTSMRVQLNGTFLDQDEVLTVRIYDVRGALVRELYAGRPSTRDVTIAWDGRDQHGRGVASSTYFAVVRAGADRETQKLLLLK